MVSKNDKMKSVESKFWKVIEGEIWDQVDGQMSTETWCDINSIGDPIAILEREMENMVKGQMRSEIGNRVLEIRRI